MYFLANNTKEASYKVEKKKKRHDTIFEIETKANAAALS